MKLVSYEVARFRPFSAPIRISAPAKLNLIVGPNNVGKTALLTPLRRLTRLASEFIPLVGTPDGASLLSDEDLFGRLWPDDYRAGEDPPVFRLVLDEIPRATVLEDLGEAEEPDPEVTEFVPPSDDRAFRAFLKGPIGIEIEGTKPGEGEPRGFRIQLDDATFQRVVSTPSTATFYAPLRRGRGSGARLARYLLDKLAQRITYVPAVREPGLTPDRPDAKLHEERRYDGQALFADLLSWYLPDPATGDAATSPAVGRLHAFLAEVLGFDVRVWPDNDQRRVLVKLGAGAPRDLLALGSGIRQLVVIGAAIARQPEAILLLEEPEISLHPGLQRALIRGLLRSDAQCFIATHSNHMIDLVPDDAKVFELGADKAGKRTLRESSQSTLRLLRDLGVRPSSVAEANAVIWVEGPSDALYIEAWLGRHKDARDLKRGVDFTFAYFGGSLLAHRSLNELLAHHPSFYLVADSDCRAPGAPPQKAYLRRLLDGGRMEGRCWITEPREIEGYLSDQALWDARPAPSKGPAVQPVAGPSNRFVSLADRFAELGMPVRSVARYKVGIARRAARQLAQASVPIEAVFAPGTDLEARVGELAAFVRHCREGVATIATALAEPRQSEV